MARSIAMTTDISCRPGDSAGLRANGIPRAKGKKDGEFYTTTYIVRLLIEMPPIQRPRSSHMLRSRCCSLGHDL
jgi:hypothetical protein